MAKQEVVYWVFGTTKAGKRIVLGYFTTEGAAREKASFLYDSVVLKLPTTNKQRAVSLYKGGLAKDAASVDSALRRVYSAGKSMRAKQTKNPDLNEDDLILEKGLMEQDIEL